MFVDAFQLTLSSTVPFFKLDFPKYPTCTFSANNAHPGMVHVDSAMRSAEQRGVHLCNNRTGKRTETICRLYMRTPNVEMACSMCNGHPLSLTLCTHDDADADDAEHIVCL